MFVVVKEQPGQQKCWLGQAGNWTLDPIRANWCDSWDGAKAQLRRHRRKIGREALPFCFVEQVKMSWEQGGPER